MNRRHNVRHGTELSCLCLVVANTLSFKDLSTSTKSWKHIQEYIYMGTSRVFVGSTKCVCRVSSFSVNSGYTHFVYREMCVNKPYLKRMVSHTKRGNAHPIPNKQQPCLDFCFHCRCAQSEYNVCAWCSCPKCGSSLGARV